MHPLPDCSSILRSHLPFESGGPGHVTWCTVCISWVKLQRRLSRGRCGFGGPHEAGAEAVLLQLHPPLSTAVDGWAGRQEGLRQVSDQGRTGKPETKTDRGSERVSLRRLDWHPDAMVTSLIPKLSCRACRPMHRLPNS